MLRQPGSSLRSRPAFGECLQEVGEQRGQRFFVERGASDGMSLRNTWLLEKWLGWKGIPTEPASNGILIFPITYSALHEFEWVAHRYVTWPRSSAASSRRSAAKVCMPTAGEPPAPRMGTDSPRMPHHTIECVGGHARP